MNRTQSLSIKNRKENAIELRRTHFVLGNDSII